MNLQIQIWNCNTDNCNNGTLPKDCEDYGLFNIAGSKPGNYTTTTKKPEDTTESSSTVLSCKSSS